MLGGFEGPWFAQKGQRAFWSREAGAASKQSVGGGGSLAWGADRGAAAVMNGFPGAGQLCQIPSALEASLAALEAPGPSHRAYVQALVSWALLRGGLYVRGWHWRTRGVLQALPARGRWLSVRQEGSGPGALGTAGPKSSLSAEVRHPPGLSIPAPGTPQRAGAPGCLWKEAQGGGPGS